MNVLQGLDEVLEVYDENYLQEEKFDENCVQEETENNKEDCDPEIGVSVLALSGERPQNTIKIAGDSKGKNLTILVDTGSTHSFMDYQTARDIKANMVATTPLMVTVANGQKVLSKLQCPGFQWVMQGHNFQNDLRIIRLEGSSIVLGIDWLRSYGKVTIDFSQDSITIRKNGQPLILKGIKEVAQLKFISASQFYQELQSGGCCIISHCQSTSNHNDTP